MKGMVRVSEYLLTRLVNLKGLTLEALSMNVDVQDLEMLANEDTVVKVRYRLLIFALFSAAFIQKR